MNFECVCICWKRPCWCIDVYNSYTMGKSKTCNETKRNEIETKRSETERNETKRYDITFI